MDIRKQRLIAAVLFSLCLAVLLGILLDYPFISRQAEPLPHDRWLVEQMQKKFPAVDVANIQDTMLIDETHYMAPFTSAQGDYGISLWTWKRTDWEVEVVHTKGMPHVWKVDPGRPETYRIIWNLDPRDSIQTLEFYLLSYRMSGRTDGVDYYRPRVQLKHSVDVMKQRYGAVPWPAAWVDYANQRLILVKNSSQRLPLPELRMGLRTLDASGMEVFPKYSVNGRRDGGTQNIEFIQIVNSAELEIVQ